MSGTIKIGEATVQIESADIIGSVWEEGSNWQIDISGNELDVGAAAFNPRLCSEDISPLSGKEFGSIDDILRESFGDTNWGAFIYFTAHIPIDGAKLSFTNPKCGKADFLLEGHCDLNWSDSFGFGVPTMASGRIGISRIDAYGCHDESSARSRIGRILKQTSELIWQPDEDGSHFLIPDQESTGD